jgi:hypothetical protein
LSVRAIFCSINQDYRLIRMTSTPNKSGLARVYRIFAGPIFPPSCLFSLSVLCLAFLS